MSVSLFSSPSRMLAHGLIPKSGFPFLAFPESFGCTPEALRLRMLFSQSIAPNGTDTNLIFEVGFFFALGAVLGSTGLQFPVPGKIQNREVSPFQCILQTALPPLRSALHNPHTP